MRADVLLFAAFFLLAGSTWAAIASDPAIPANCYLYCYPTFEKCMQPCNSASTYCYGNCGAACQQCGPEFDRCSDACMDGPALVCVRDCMVSRGIPRVCANLWKNYNSLQDQPLMLAFVKCLETGSGVVTPTKPVCGNGACESGESLSSCPSDCKPKAVCGNGACEAGEDAYGCPQDCAYCGNGACDEGNGETAQNCPSDCVGCGDGDCDAEGGEDRESCPQDCAVCGDGFCDFIEITECPRDCGECGNGVCERDKGEDEENCPGDCPLCGNGVCNFEKGETYESCPDDCLCGNKECDADKGENENNCPDDCKEDCLDEVDNDGNGKIDCDDDACKKHPVCGPIRGRVLFTDVIDASGRQGDRLLRRAAMYATWVDSASGQQRVSSEFYSNEQGEYIFDNPSIHRPRHATVTVFAKLTDKAKSGQVVERNSVVKSKVEVTPEKLATGEKWDVVFGSYDFESGTHPADGAKIYFHWLELTDFATAAIGKTVPTENIEIYSASTNCGGGTCHAGALPDWGITIPPGESPYYISWAPGNREYHEASHHIMVNLFEKMPPHHKAGNTYLDVNHIGYRNHCTGDSWTEGFAEFMSLYINSQTGVPKRCTLQAKPYTYCTGVAPFQLEDNIKANESYEELAVASLLWDAYDNGQVNGGADDDTLSVDFGTLWNVMVKKRDFPIYYSGVDSSPRNVWYVKDLYDAMKAEGIGSTDVNGDGFSELDDLFFGHGFAYRNAGGAWVFGQTKEGRY